MANLQPKQSSYEEKRDDIEISAAGADVASEAQKNDLHRGLEARQISMIALVRLFLFFYSPALTDLWDVFSRVALCALLTPESEARRLAVESVLTGFFQRDRTRHWKWNGIGSCRSCGNAAGLRVSAPALDMGGRCNGARTSGG